MIAMVVSAALMQAACANPSIVSARVQSVTSSGAVNHYTIAISVENEGTLKQPSNLLQSVIVSKDGQRLDRIGLQPLRPKQTQTVRFTFDRGTDAGSGTTDLTLTLSTNGREGNDVDCHAGQETLILTI